MDEPVHGRRAAIYATEHKRLPPSFYWGLAGALALHIGGVYYLLQTQFGHAPAEPIPVLLPDKPTEVTIERLKRPDKPAPPHVIRVHDTPQQTVPDSPPLIPNKTPDVVDTIVGPPVLPVPGGVGGTTAIGGDGGGDMVAARWSRFPDGEALVEYYPSKASDAEIEGQATVQCVVLDSSGRVSCVVVGESPGGYGFGAATARMVQDKGRVDTTHGDVAKGSMLRQTVHWRLN